MGSSTIAEEAGFRAVLWEKGVMIDLNRADATVSTSLARGINARGQIVGEIGATPVLWGRGVLTTLGITGGGQASAINAAGRIAGAFYTADPFEPRQRGFLWDKGRVTDLGTLGGRESVAWGINPEGQIVGDSETAGGETHAFVWKAGTMTDLGPGIAVRINPSGEVVGSSPTPDGRASHATLWTRH